jgi:hypothetical protein
MRKPAEEESCNKECFGYGVFYFVLGVLLVCKGVQCVIG